MKAYRFVIRRTDPMIWGIYNQCFHFQSFSMFNVQWSMFNVQFFQQFLDILGTQFLLADKEAEHLL